MKNENVNCYFHGPPQPSGNSYRKAAGEILTMLRDLGLAQPSSVPPYPDMRIGAPETKKISAQRPERLLCAGAWRRNRGRKVSRCGDSNSRLRDPRSADPH